MAPWCFWRQECAGRGNSVVGYAALPTLSIANLKSEIANPTVAKEEIPHLPEALDILKGLQAAPGLYDLAQSTQIVVSKLWAGAGGSALLGRVNLPPWATECPVPQLACLLAHELTHVRQGIFFFGSMDTEREAFITQWRAEIELLKQQKPLPKAEIARKEAELEKLESSFESARAFIVSLAPYYATFPDRQPKWWEVDKWWPQAAYAIQMSGGNKGAGGAA